jgi:hypothetical protein
MAEYSDDIFPLRAPLQFSENLKEVVKSLNEIYNTASNVQKVLNNATSISGMRKATDDLVKANGELYKVQTLVVESAKEKTLAEKELEKIERQIATVTAKNTEEYRKQVAILDKAKKDLKEKIALGDRDAKTVNRQNASLDELRAALTRNRVAYRALANEEARASKEGQELLRIIQQQDKDVKELSKSLGQHQDNVGNYTEATEALDNQLGGLIGRVKDLGKQFIALATNPIFLALVVLIGLFKAVKSAAEAYYTTTLEGEEALSRRKATLDAFFTTLRTGWAEVGKAADDALGDNGLRKLLGGVIAYIFPNLIGKFAILEQKAQELSEIQIRLQKLILRETINGAQDELKYNKLLEDSRKKLQLTDEQRLEAIREARELLGDQYSGDVKQIRLTIEAQEKHIESLGGVIAKVEQLDESTGKVVVRSKLLTEYTEEELKALYVIGEERQKLAELQAELINKEAEYTSKRTSLLKIEAQLVNEIEATRRAAAQRIQDAELQKQQQTNLRMIEYNRSRLTNEELTTQQQIDITKEAGDLELELLQKQKDQELTIIRRAAEDANRERAQVMANSIAPDLGINESIALQNKLLAQLLENDEAYQLQKSTLTAKYNQMERAQLEKNAQEIVNIKRHEIEEQLKVVQLGLEKEIAEIKQQAVDGVITRRQADTAILEARKSANVRFIDESIRATKEILAIENLLVDEAVEIKAKIEQLKLNLVDALFEMTEDPSTSILDVLKKIQMAYSDFASSLNNLFSSLTEQRLQEIDLLQQANEKYLNDQLEAHEKQAEIDSLIAEDNFRRQEQAYKQQLEEGQRAAGDDLLVKDELQKQYDENLRNLTQARVDFELNKDAEKAAIQNEFARKDLELRRKAANAERQAAVFAKATGAIQAAINTAVAVTELGVVTPLAIAAGIAGAIQVAAILAKPIPPVPQFYKGGTAPGGDIMVGEFGTELMRYPSGRLELSPDRATILKNIPAGTQIIPHDETMQFLAIAAMEGITSSDVVVQEKGNVDLRLFNKKIESLERTIRRKREVHINLTTRGVEASIRNSETRSKIFNDLFR